MNWEKKYLKYKKKYFELKGGDDTYITEAYYPYGVEENIIFIKELIIDPSNTSHMAFRAFTDRTRKFISLQLNNNSRFDKLKRDGIVLNDDIKNKTNGYLIDLIIWLFNKLWSKACTHGDLGINNLIIDFEKNTVFVIDWAGTMDTHKDILIKQHRFRFYIDVLIDIYDVINSFKITFDIDIYDDLLLHLYQIKKEETMILDDSTNEYSEHLVNNNIELLKIINSMITAKFNIPFVIFSKKIDSELF